MSGWVAINVEQEAEDFIDVDDTKEIQLEEAFKLYQNALRLHSQGAAYYDEARQAYDELFASEVFKYPEAASSFDQETTEEVTSSLIAPQEIAILPTLGGASDNANSLPQFVYLAYKSRAQFEVDASHALLHDVSTLDRDGLLKHYELACNKSLQDAAAALERDDTDLDLWKRASRVADVLQTARIVRFTLESVLAGDDDGDDAIDLSGLDEAYAKGELQKVVEILEDDLTQWRTSHVQPRNKLLKHIAESNDPYPFVPRKTSQIEYVNDAKRPLAFSANTTSLDILSPTYLAVTKALVSLWKGRCNQSIGPGAGAYLTLRLLSRGSVADTHLSGELLTETTRLLPNEPSVDSPSSFHSAPERTDTSSHITVIEGDNKSTAEAKPATQNEPDPVGEVTTQQEPVSLPSRKRSSTAAGNEEPEARTKSKRIKARESMVTPAIHDEEPYYDPSFIYHEQMESIQAADEVTLKVINSILEKIDIDSLGPLEALRAKPRLTIEGDPGKLVESGAEPASSRGDLQHALKTWNEEMSSAFGTGHTGRDRVEKSTGMSLFLKHTQANAPIDPAPGVQHDLGLIQRFISEVNKRPTTIEEALFLWLALLLTHDATRNVASPYTLGVWSAELKQEVQEVLVLANELLVLSFRRSQSQGWSKNLLAEFAQTVFELHIDIYSEITNPASTVDDRIRKEQWQRLQAWAQLASDTMQFIPALDQASDVRNESIDIILRFLWASVVFAKLASPSDKSHVLLCLQDLKQVLETAEISEIRLLNNTAMPLISTAAVDQEMSKVKTLDFFMGVFNSNSDDPFSVIMKLEPILEYDENDSPNEGLLSEQEQILDFRAFLKTGDASLTLFMWRKLQNAYTTISYGPKVISCLFRSLETITDEIGAMYSRDIEAPHREIVLLRWMREADELVTKILAKTTDDNAAFDCIDEPHLRSSTTSVVTLLRLLYNFVVIDDDLRVGDMDPPFLRNATAGKNFEKCRDRFREMFVRLWVLLYHLIKEASVQFKDCFDDPTQELILFLRSVHSSVGRRQYCKHCNKLFVRTAKVELFSFNTDEDLSADIAQVIYDLYHIKLCAGSGDANHGCPPELLDRDKRTAQTLVPIIMDYIRRLNLKEILRSDLKATIDRIQNALGQSKSTTMLQFNRKVVSSYLKSVISPKQLYQALRGIGELETKVVHGEFANIAAQGWYLLVGNVTLAKYKSVKRVNPTPTDELDNAMLYLRLDIDHDPGNWESWYRLAQVFDAKIEDNMIWNSNKLNDGRSELATLERSAINAYAMATAIAMRSASDDITTTRMIDDMFFEFAVRLYASSRPPLQMEALNTEKAVRHLSHYISQQMSKQPQFAPISEYSLWSLCVHLIRRSLAGESKPWARYYMLGKCLWKMFNNPPGQQPSDSVDAEDIIESFTEAVNRVPKKERAADPILEPHFKLVSTIHKLVVSRRLPTAAAVQHLQVTQYARGVQLETDEQGRADWEGYVLAVLKKLQNADKSGWHHRITARAAHIHYSGSAEDIKGALGAKHQFIDSIVTKSMMMQVWKPENERAGRHYVYTGRYLRFFVKVLETLKDRSNLEQVVRKIRRKTTDFIDHPHVWEEAVTAYVDLLRNLSSIPRSKERSLFDNITFDEFTRQSEKLESWAHDPDTTTRYLDVIKDAIEMKKLNNSLMKGSAIDDLIGDAYACMYEEYVAQLPPEEQEASNTALPQGTFINMTTNTIPAPGEDNIDRMRLNTILTGQTDGTSSDQTRLGMVPGQGLGIVTDIPQAVSTPPPDALRVPAPAKPGRTKTITRREVQRKAEGAIGKPPPIKTPTLTKRSISINVPSIKKDNSADIDLDDDGSVKDYVNAASGMSSRRGSGSMRNTPNPEADDGDDEGEDGDDGDNEAEEDDDNDHENEDDRDSDAEEQASSHQKAIDKDDDGEEQEEDGDERARDTDVKAEQTEDDDSGPEIPDSQDAAGMTERSKAENAMDVD